MPAFRFEALDDQGLTRKGVVEADSAKSARSQLRTQALVPLVVEPVGDAPQAGSAGALGTSLFTRPVFGATALAIWTRQLAGLVSSGLPLERALTALSDEAENERQRHLVAVLRAEVNAGSTFARALQQHPREFADIYDLVGVRILVESIRDCYAVLGIVHARWSPVPGRFKDFIAMPKPNMYQSLHTSVMSEVGQPFEEGLDVALLASAQHVGQFVDEVIRDLGPDIIRYAMPCGCSLDVKLHPHGPEGMVAYQ